MRQVSSARTLSRSLVLLGALAGLGRSATAQSLKTVPAPHELIEHLKRPTSPATARVPFPGLPALPSLDFQLLEVNALTGQPLLLEALPDQISYDIPAFGFTPFTFGAPYRPLVPPENESDYIVDRAAAIQLGKALFWDMQLGSDGVQACASCHFHAGTDDRVRNSLNPGTNAGDTTLQVKGKNLSLTASDYPFHELEDPGQPGEPLLNPSNVKRDANDVTSSMGIRFRRFVDIPTPGSAAFISGTNPPALRPDLGQADADPLGTVFQGVRRVEPRNTPSVFGASHAYDSFWDGRARSEFNGGSPFGASDPSAHVFLQTATGLSPTRAQLALSGLASQALGPALSDFEMSFRGRSWGKIAKKLLQSGVVPLANQLVAADDSVLGPLSSQSTASGRAGLATSYRALIQQAFRADLWSNTTQHLVLRADATDPFDGIRLVIASGPSDPANRTHLTQMEANFALFFGLAVQAYTQLLQPDDTPFDQFHDANPFEFLGDVEDIDPAPGVQVVGLTPRQLYGYDLFQGSNLSRLNPTRKTGSCNVCHFGQELSEHTARAIHGYMPADPFTGADRVLAGFELESFLKGPARIAVELDTLDMALDEFGLPSGIALTDKGIYNIGVRPSSEDLGRGGNDPFGFPLSRATLALRNEGFPVGTFSDPLAPVPPLPAQLAAAVNPLPLGFAFPFVMQPIFEPDAIAPVADLAELPSGTYPTPNRVARSGSFKVPGLRNIELTGPYFHNGGVLTLRQVIDFYARGGDFPITNSADRDPLIMDLHRNFDAFFTEADEIALVDFLLSLTDERVRFRRAPFDHPELIVPVDGAAPDNQRGRAALLADARFRRIAPVGAGGSATPLTSFLGVSSLEGSAGPDHFDAITGGTPPPPPPSTLILAAPVPGTAGVLNRWVVTGATPGASVAVYTSLTTGTTTLNVGNCGGIVSGLGGPPNQVARATASASGTATIEFTPSATLAGKTYFFQAIEPSTCRKSNVVSDQL